MVKPILLYCSDFWGVLKQPKNNPIERVHISFLKQLLGVRQQTNNSGVYLELGSTPITFNAAKASIIKNWERIRQYNCNDLLSATYEEATTDFLPWAASIREIFSSNGMLETFLTAGSEDSESQCPNMLLFQRLKDQFNQGALENIKEGSKLQFYSLLKTDVGYERYLTDVRNVKHRIELTRLRLSSHSLHIETGRHTATPREDRICTLCKNNVEDETHALVQCPMYQDIRTFDTTQTILTDNISDMDKAVKLMKLENQSLLAELVHKIFTHRGIMLDSLATINDVVDSVASRISADDKIERDVKKTLSDMLSSVEKSERLYKVSKFDDRTLKMTIDKPRISYKIKEKSSDGLKILLSKM